ncbi:hypothetical protein G9A89_011838 [Geosiphon pyriformis]|nr:hypothetical protein G9A89_011838 [Geosiphon pyriformis]
MTDWLNQVFASSEDDSDEEFVPNNNDGEDDGEKRDTSATSPSDDGSSYSEPSAGKLKRGRKKAATTANGNSSRKVLLVDKPPAKVRKTSVKGKSPMAPGEQLVIGEGEASSSAITNKKQNHAIGSNSGFSCAAQETEHKRLIEIERGLQRKKQQLIPEVEESKEKADDEKNTLKNLQSENQLMKQKIDTLHETLKPVFNQLIGMDKLDDINVAAFLLEFGRQIRDGVE